MGTDRRLYADKYGTDASKITKAVHLYVSLWARARLRALRKVVRVTLAKRYGFEPHLPDPRAILVGTPDDCAQTIEDHMKAGCDPFRAERGSALARGEGRLRALRRNGAAEIQVRGGGMDSGSGAGMTGLGERGLSGVYFSVVSQRRVPSVSI